MVLTELKSNDEFNNLFRSENLAVVHFYAPWADQCVQINSILEELAAQPAYKSVQFANIVAEDFPRSSLKCKIAAVPTTVIMKQSEILARVDGANPTQIKDQIDKYLPEEAKEEQLQARLQALIDSAPCILFMKGNRETPRCGFSKSMIALLEELGAAYETFDILEDSAVREGLKKFSNWPTYPQLYVRGELVGGLDIVKELIKAGELDEMIPKKAQSAGSLEDRLKKLINRAPCMLFMKGNRETPKCGFSRTIVALLDEHKAKYETFDILEDSIVREGLKKFSNWPTYPQLYIKGELIGGLDIVKEMSEAGDLDEMLPKK